MPHITLEHYLKPRIVTIDFSSNKPDDVQGERIAVNYLTSPSGRRPVY